jgi:osmotically inducible protein OsmC
MPTRSSEATWDGTLTEGSGHLALGSGVWEGPYNFVSRFESGDETNPEELIAAAHAGCYNMALANGLEESGYPPERLHTTADVHLDAEALEIDQIDLTVEGEVPEADEETFLEHAEAAKENCPVSKVLAGANIDLTAELV